MADRVDRMGLTGEVMKKKLKMQLFGSFSLENETESFGEDALRSAKLTRLLVFLLMNRDYVLSHQRLVELFLDNDSKSPEGALKNLMYRLRNALKVLGDEQFICTVPGAYRWNPEIEVETDYERFEEMDRSLRYTEHTQEERKQLCQEIMEVYHGNVSAQVIEEPWILPKAAWYRSIYLDTAKHLCEIYEQEGKWYELEVLCGRALTEDAFEENIHCWFLRSLHKQKKYDQAMMHYEKINKLFYGQMGIGVSEKVRDAFHEIMKDTGESVSDIESLLQEVREHEKPMGAFFCDYQIFRQIYRVEARRISRLGMAEYVLLLTVWRTGSLKRNPGMDSSMHAGMDILEKLLQEQLRMGDIVSRYSPTQFAVMLPMCTCESAMRVMERLKKCFQKQIGSRKLELKYELAELESVDEEKEAGRKQELERVYE